MHMYIGLAKDIEVRGKPLQLEWIYTIGEGHSGRRKPQGRQRETTLANTWYVRMRVCSCTILRC